jgi:hypothetical protein
MIAAGRDGGVFCGVVRAQTLQCFWTNTEYISQCQFVLDNSNHPYAQLLASSSLVRQVTEHTSSNPQVRALGQWLAGYEFARSTHVRPYHDPYRTPVCPLEERRSLCGC